jgi:hypothetical protein
MKFQVPQYIEVEDKIFGPFTFKQTVYVAGSAGVAFALWTTLPKLIAILIGAPIVAIGIALAFYKVNNRPFVNMLEAAFSYMIKNRLYIWKKSDKKVVRKTTKEAQEAQKKMIASLPTLSESKLKDLAWSLDIQESIYSKEDQRK